MTIYDDTTITSTLNPFDFFTAMNELSGGLLVQVIIFVIYLILFVGFKHKPTRVGMTISSFILVIISLGALILEWITWEFLVLPMIMFFISLIVLLFYSE